MRSTSENHTHIKPMSSNRAIHEHVQSGSSQDQTAAIVYKLSGVDPFLFSLTLGFGKGQNKLVAFQVAAIARFDVTNICRVVFRV